MSEKLLTVVSRATNGLTKAATAVAKEVAALQELNALTVELAEEIEFQTSEIKSLEQKKDDAVRRFDAELQLAKLEGEEALLGELLTTRGLSSIPTQELYNLRSDLQTAQENNEDAVNEAVAKAKALGESKLASAVTAAKQEASLEAAEDKALIKQQISTIADLRDSLREAKQALADEREARVEIAKYAQPTLAQPSQSK